MDIYRFFHPHHNPRLLGTAVRQQELVELEQAASELLRSVKRAWQRTVKHHVGELQPTDFANLIEALQYCKSTLAKICDKHPGDSLEHLEDLIHERADLPAWSNWARLVGEQIALGGSLADNRLILEARAASLSAEASKLNSASEQSMDPESQKEKQVIAA